MNYVIKRDRFYIPKVRHMWVWHATTLPIIISLAVGISILTANPSALFILIAAACTTFAALPYADITSQDGGMSFKKVFVSFERPGREEYSMPRYFDHKNMDNEVYAKAANDYCKVRLTGEDMDTSEWSEVFRQLNSEVETWRSFNRSKNSPKDNYVEQLKIANGVALEVSSLGV
ncbi:hypothetical protein PBI_GRAYSON_187 [Rhodococcus phage Grayson]|nr:hypothetical protein PBI_GRAYSON_187 [Rhodococcus phage Grayson]